MKWREPSWVLIDMRWVVPGRTVACLARRTSENVLLILRMHSTAHNAAKDNAKGGSSSSCSEIAVPQ
eukprot:5613491-Heterocapsa_arctica.AAC.1